MGGAGAVAVVSCDGCHGRGVKSKPGTEVGSTCLAVGRGVKFAARETMQSTC